MSQFDFDPPMVKHIPLCPPRESFAAEMIYLKLWQEWCEARPKDWYAIFNDRHTTRQRAASVAASFMVFMGCNAGKCFTLKCIDYAESRTFGVDRASAFIAAWAVENRRISWINSGLRMIEYMLATRHPIIRGPYGGARLDISAIGSITLDDVDTIEDMVVWWSTKPAEDLRAVAEPMINAAIAKSSYANALSTGNKQGAKYGQAELVDKNWLITCAPKKEPQ